MDFNLTCSQAWTLFLGHPVGFWGGLLLTLEAMACVGLLSWLLIERRDFST